jgi:hypothetical protein
VRNLQFLHGKTDCLPKAARARPVGVARQALLFRNYRKIAPDHATMASSAGLDFLVADDEQVMQQAACLWPALRGPTPNQSRQPICRLRR